MGKQYFFPAAIAHSLSGFPEEHWISYLEINRRDLYGRAFLHFTLHQS
jgi:hypothetical protein